MEKVKAGGGLARAAGSLERGRRRTSVLLKALVGTLLIQALNLLDKAVVQTNYIFGLDISRLVGTQQLELGTDAEQLIQNRLFRGIQRNAHRRRVGHDGFCLRRVGSVRWGTRGKHGGALSYLRKCRLT